MFLTPISDDSSDSAMPMLSPPLKWAGGKRWLVPELKTIFARHNHRRLVEPFVGGLSVTLGLRPKRALIADINPWLVNFYVWLRKGLIIEQELLNDRQFFFVQRERFNELVRQGQGTIQEAAELFYFLNRTCFNGLCRFNSKGEFNVPFGRYKAIPYIKDFSAYKAVATAWDIKCCDFAELVISDDDFLYVDPPYDVEFTKYSKEDFKWEDQIRLVTWLKKHKGPAVVSNQATDRICELYSEAGFKITVVDAPRRISCTGDRKKAQEMFATKGI